MLQNRLLLLISLWATVTIFSSCAQQKPITFTTASTVAVMPGDFSEPFGIAVKGDEIFVSDGQNGKILKITEDGTVSEFASGLDTPSSIVFAQNGDLIVADTGDHTIKSVNGSGVVTKIAGTEQQAGNTFGPRDAAPFNGPTGLAIKRDGEILFSDTYNDRIGIIRITGAFGLAGTSRGYRDGNSDAQFDTPLGLAVWKDKVLVADAGNRRIRVIEPDGQVWTFAGNGEQSLKDGPLLEAAFVQPTAIAVNDRDQIFITDGNAIRVINGRGVFPYVVTLSGGGRGFADGNIGPAKFNRPSGVAFSSTGELLIADSENGFVRKIGSSSSNQQEQRFQPKQLTAEEFKKLQPPRWPFDPPQVPRDIAGTLGELRGTVGSDVPLRFHNGLDIAGAYGEIARFIRSEKVLDPMSAENFGTLRELVRLPQIGYIHIRLGRDQNDRMLANSKFQPQFDPTGKIIDLRVRRGTKFKAGEPIGTLNAMNHVHLIAGASGGEINALAALELPGVSDSIAPTIENAGIRDQHGSPVETKTKNERIKLAGKYRVVVRAFDRMDGNPERRKLGVYKLGYQLLREDGTPLGEVNWTIAFDRMPLNDLARFVYGEGSHSGASGETIYNYIVTNKLTGEESGERFFDTADLAEGNYSIRVLVGDYFGNVASKDIPIEVIK